jgi:hypothetical protein
MLESNLSSSHGQSDNEIPRKLSTKDFDTQAMVIQSLTREFLDVPEKSLEVRSYLVDKTIPTVVLALDNLLREVEKRGLLKGSQNVEGDRPKFDAINWLGIY